MSNRPWMFDMSIKCPFCGEHEMKYSSMNCSKYKRQLNEKYFVMLKFTELENRIKELEETVVKISLKLAEEIDKNKKELENNVLELRSETRGTKVEGR